MYQKYFKRALDLILSLFGSILLLPVFAIVSVLILLEDGAPVFFRQSRVGLGGRSFRIFKFRSMSVISETNGSVFTPGDTSRVTKMGRFLRRTKIDELPQLFNVVLGDMSLVGPRPEIQKWVSAYEKRWTHVLTVRPGITDQASIVFRNEEELLANSDDADAMYQSDILPKKLDLYERYVDRVSVTTDGLIILNTLKALVK